MSRLDDPELQARREAARARMSLQRKADQEVIAERNRKLRAIEDFVEQRFDAGVRFEEHWGGPPGGICSFYVLHDDQPTRARVRDYVKAELERVGIPVDHENRDVTHIGL